MLDLVLSDYFQRMLSEYPDHKHLNAMHKKFIADAPYREAGEREWAYYVWAEVHRHQRALRADRRIEARQLERARWQRIETISAWVALPLLAVLTVLCFAL